MSNFENLATDAVDTLNINVVCTFQHFNKLFLISYHIVVQEMERYLRGCRGARRDFQSVGTVIPAYLHMRNTLAGFCRPGSVVVYCKPFAKDLMESLDRRFEYVLSDTHYLLGIFI